jgi:secondary thiamine-phosphate synthase enzyme
MRKTSAPAVGELPVPCAVAAAGGLVVSAGQIEVESTRRVDIVDVTGRVTAVVREAGVRDGLVSLWLLHTTCALLVNEWQAALVDDMLKFFERLAPEDHAYRHNDPAHSECDRQNADAHLRALVLGPSLTLQVRGGDVVLGQWQRILMAELDGPRARAIRVQVMGVGEAGSSG